MGQPAGRFLYYDLCDFGMDCDLRGREGDLRSKSWRGQPPPLLLGVLTSTETSTPCWRTLAPGASAGECRKDPRRAGGQDLKLSILVCRKIHFICHPQILTFISLILETYDQAFRPVPVTLDLQSNYVFHRGKRRSGCILKSLSGFIRFIKYFSWA